MQNKYQAKGYYYLFIKPQKKNKIFRDKDIAFCFFRLDWLKRVRYTHKRLERLQS